MSYWENTTYVQHRDPAEVAQRLAELFMKEGMEAVPALSPRTHRGLDEPMQYATALENDEWGVALFPGAASWTVVKTAPLELLAERRPGADRMRLAELCARLRVSAVQVNVHGTTGIVLVEVSRDGEVLLSGFNELGRDPFVWYSERLEQDTYRPVFRIHHFEDERLREGEPRASEIAAALSAGLGGANAEYCDNLVSVDTLITQQPFTAPGGIATYFRWRGPSRVRPARR